MVIHAFVFVFQVFAAVIRNPRLHSATYVLISNLAITDIFFSLGIPFIATTRITQHWVFNDFFCKTVTYIQFISGICSILTMMSISIERFLCVCLMNRYKLSAKHLALVISCIWIIATGFPVPVALAQSLITIHTTKASFTFCGVSWEEEFHTEIYLGFMGTLFFLVPLIVISSCYLRILRVVNTSADRTRAYQNDGKSARKQVRLVKMCSSIVFLFVVMWLPFFIISFLGVHFKQITSTHFTATLILALANTCVNPLLYGYFNLRFRDEFKTMCCQRFIKTSQSRTSTYGAHGTDIGSAACNSSTV